MLFQLVQEYDTVDDAKNVCLTDLITESPSVCFSLILYLYTEHQTQQQQQKLLFVHVVFPCGAYYFTAKKLFFFPHFFLI